MLRAVACALLKTCTARRPHIRALACVRTRLSFQYHMYAARTVRQLTVPSIFTRYLHGSLLRTPWLTSRPLRSCRVRQRVERKPWITLAHTLRIRHFATSASDPPPAKLDLSLLTEDEKENTLVDADLLEYIPSEFVKFNMAYRNAWLLEYIAQIFPTQVAQDYLNLIHVWTHSPWWFSIILATIGIKLLTIPVMIVQEKNFMRRTMIARKINNKAAAIKGLGLSMWESFRLRWKSTTIVYKKHNISRFKMIVVPITQIPMWLTFAFGIRLMVITYPEFTEGGILWFKDLSVLDPTLILPYAAITTTYISILVCVKLSLVLITCSVRLIFFAENNNRLPSLPALVMCSLTECDLSFLWH